MAELILFTHADATESTTWPAYLESLRTAGVFRGGSSIGAGICARKDGAARPVSEHIVGFIRIDTADLAHAQRLLAGHPAFEAGGTVEIRELPRD
jgi:hypothetical protein